MSKHGCDGEKIMGVGISFTMQLRSDSRIFRRRSLESDQPGASPDACPAKSAVRRARPQSPHPRYRAPRNHDRDNHTHLEAAPRAF